VAKPITEYIILLQNRSKILKEQRAETEQLISQRARARSDRSDSPRLNQKKKIGLIPVFYFAMKWRSRTQTRRRWIIERLLPVADERSEQRRMKALEAR
jgi:hypothetical protein